MIVKNSEILSFHTLFKFDATYEKKLSFSFLFLFFALYVFFKFCHALIDKIVKEEMFEQKDSEGRIIIEL